MNQLRFAPLIRVSTEQQKKRGESLSTQKKQITSYVESLNGCIPDECWKYSGQEHSTVGYERALLDKLLADSAKGIFDAVIVCDASRWSRNNLKSEQGLQVLRTNKIRFFCGSQEMDLNHENDVLMLTMSVAFAQFQARQQTRKSTDNRFQRAKDSKIPTSGHLPFARKFDKITGQWSLDEEKAQKIRTAAELYLNGVSMVKIAAQLDMDANYLTQVLHHKCGDKWTVLFKGKGEITFDIPALLSPVKIQAIQERMKFNHRNNRNDVPQKYVLSGFLRCEHCSTLLCGQTQIINDTKYEYYLHHSREKGKTCPDQGTINMKHIENAVFTTIFENFVDVPAFEQAIAQSLPSEDLINTLQEKIAADKAGLSKIQTDLDKLVDMALEGTLSKESIKKRDQELMDSRLALQESLGKNTRLLQSMPNPDEVRSQADRIRRSLLDQYSGVDRLTKMTYDEKRELLHWLFDGKDSDGKPYGIYTSKTASGIDYFMYGRIVGLRTMRGEDVDYQEPDNDFNTLSLSVWKPMVKNSVIMNWKLE